MILIVGASGAVGTPTIRHLAARGEKLRALTSNPKSAERLKSLGVAETVVGDFRKDADVAKAFAGGVTSVMYVPPRFQEDEAEIGRRVVDAAKRANVEHFLFASAFHPQLRDLGHHWQKLEIEEYLIDSDLMYTVVQPSMFMQNLRVEWPRVLKDGVYARPYSPDSKLSVIDTHDLGEACANILTDPKLRGATYQLNGDGPISHAEMAAMIGDTIGRKVTAVHRDIGEWRDWAKANGWADYSIQTYTAMCHHYDTHGYKPGNAVTLTALLGRKPTTYAEFIRRFAKEMGAG